MEPRVSLITLGVRDLQRSLKFYRDGLGLPTTWDGAKGVVFFQTSGVCVALYGLESLAEDIGWPRDSSVSTYRGVVLAHNVRQRDEVDALMQQAKAAGAEIIKPAQDAFWGGYSGYFADPDGHLWEIAWGAFDFRDDGSLIIP